MWMTVLAGSFHVVSCTHLPVVGSFARYETHVGWLPVPMDPTLCIVMFTAWPAGWACVKSMTPPGIPGLRKDATLHTMRPTATKKSPRTVASLPLIDIHHSSRFDVSQETPY